MKSVFASAIASLWKPNKTVIDNWAFRLHYKWTALLLLVFAVVVTARQYIGHPIHCTVVQKAKLPEDFLNAFCWASATFSVETAWKKTVGSEVPYPGVDNGHKKEDLVYHTYYQWVCFLLFIQSLMFYAPRYFWSNVEGKRINRLALCLVDVTSLEEQREIGVKVLVKYMERQRNNHHLYFWGFALAEIFNFVNVLGQMFMVNRFLGGKFMSYGVDVLRYGNWTGGIQYDPLVELFPRLTKCQFNDFGHGGSVQLHNALCVLPINIINEKIYLFLWFWFCFLLTMSSLAILYRVVVLVLPRARLISLRTDACHAKCSDLELLVQRSDIGDWFLLKLLAKNIDALDFRDFVAEYVKTTFDKNGNTA